MIKTQPNGPREQKSTGRLRNTLTNTASKQDPSSAQKPGKASYGRHTRPASKTTKFQEESKLQKLATKTEPKAPTVQAPTRTPTKVLPIATAGTALVTALAALKNGNKGGGSYPAGGDAKANIQLAKQIAAEYGWKPGTPEWRAFRSIGMRESGFNHTAANPTSSARGIAQAMMSVHFGEDWESNPKALEYMNSPEVQLRWMADYILGRYKTPSAALRFHLKEGYY